MCVNVFGPQSSAVVPFELRPGSARRGNHDDRYIPYPPDIPYPYDSDHPIHLMKNKTHPVYPIHPERTIYFDNPTHPNVVRYGWKETRYHLDSDSSVHRVKVAHNDQFYKVYD